MLCRRGHSMLPCSARLSRTGRSGLQHRWRLGWVVAFWDWRGSGSTRPHNSNAPPAASYSASTLHSHTTDTRTLRSGAVQPLRFTERHFSLSKSWPPIEPSQGPGGLRIFLVDESVRPPGLQQVTQGPPGLLDSTRSAGAHLGQPLDLRRWSTVCWYSWPFAVTCPGFLGHLASG